MITRNFVKISHFRYVLNEINCICLPIKRKNKILFHFQSTPTCCVCNGYYAPSFGEPLCGTCHAFLFPVIAEEKRLTDLSDNDEDSGNDEPPYKEFRDANAAFAINRSGDGRNDEVDPENDDEPSNGHPVEMNDANEPAAQILVTPMRRSSNDRFAIYENAFLGDRPDPQPPRNLRQYLNALTENHEMANQNAVRQPIVINEISIEAPAVVGAAAAAAAAATAAGKPGNTMSALPVEVLLLIFSYLDDISLCRVGDVCKQWKNILEVHTPQSLWQRYTRMRWPLYHQITQTTNWFKVFKNCK